MANIKHSYTRVTEVISPFCKFDGIDENILKNAADRGTRVHYCCELELNNQFVMPDEEVKPYFDSFCLWKEEMLDKVLHTEMRLYNDLLRITGAMDIVGQLKNDEAVTIIDIKTPQQESKSWNIQLAAYQYLFNNDANTKKTATRRIALMLSKKGKYPRVIEYTQHERDWELFKGIFNAYRYFNGMG